MKNNLIGRVIKLEKSIQAIEKRNHRVEADKAWETSMLRRIAIAILTYITILTFFIAANLPNPWVNALVPTVAFVLSTFSLELLRRIFKN